MRTAVFKYPTIMNYSRKVVNFVYEIENSSVFKEPNNHELFMKNIAYS